MPRRGDGRLRRQTDDDSIPRREVAPLVAPSRLARSTRRLDGAGNGTGPEAAGGGAQIDGAVLDELTGGDSELAGAIVCDFVTASREDFRALELALAGRDLDAARRQAHRLKGAARTVGAHAIGDLAEQIERDAARGVDDWPRYTVIVAQLDEAVTHIELPAARHRT
jgi:HPt (histidine-containing phosphotransfer) domain-containing protein